ncbi:MAG: nuclear transport factor 2 family protein [Pseudomonadota bacterium]
MKRLLVCLVFGLAACAEPKQIGLPTCDSVESSEAGEVFRARENLNAALAVHDSDTLRLLMAQDIVRVTGADSIILSGHDQVIALSRSRTEDDADRPIYRFESKCIRVSAIEPIALEQGAWRATAGDIAFVAGSYAAKWRRDEEGWKLEADILSTEGCGGMLCP